MNDPAICDLAKKTIDVLNEDGWSQGQYTDDFGSHCLVGAIWSASGRHNLTFGSSQSLMEKLSPLVPNHEPQLIPKLNLIRWNDSGNRTKEDVIGLLQKVCA